MYSSQSYDADLKLSALQEFLVSLLTPICSCSLSTEYIAQANLTCDGDLTLFQGALVGTPETGGAELHGQLQSWVDEGQKIEIIWMPLKLPVCSTFGGCMNIMSK